MNTKRKRDEIPNSEKHPGHKHAWIFMGTDNVHGVTRDVWRCEWPERCGRDTDPAKRIHFMDKAMREMAQEITGHPSDIGSFAIKEG